MSVIGNYNYDTLLPSTYEAVRKKVWNKPPLTKGGCNLCLGVSLSVFMHDQ